jgi:prepilin-type processing-associated H-X9-DG protein
MQARSFRSRLPLVRIETNARRGLSQIEVVITVAIIALLVALLVPAVQSSRAASRKIQCAANLRQIGIAIGAYESAHQMFPPGGSYGASMHVSLLPFIDQKNLFDRYDFVNRDDSAVRIQVVSLYLCPSDSAPQTWPFRTPGEAATSYAGNSGTGVMKYGYNGMFRHISAASPPLRDGPIRAADVRHGLSNTAAVSEILHGDGTMARLRVNWNTPQAFPEPDGYDDFAAECSGIPRMPADFGWMGDIQARGLPWTYGDIGRTMYNHVLGPNQPSCYNGTFVQTGIVSAGSAHAGGVNVLLADGHVVFISDSVDLFVWRDLGSRVASDIQIAALP